MLLIFQVEVDITDVSKRVNELAGIKESDTGLGPPALWDLAADKQTLQSEQPLQVARCTKIINADTDDPKYIINVKQFAKFVVDLADQVRAKTIFSLNLLCLCSLRLNYYVRGFNYFF
jgi:26S proteasome regulatory subunit T1